MCRRVRERIEEREREEGFKKRGKVGGKNGGGKSLEEGRRKEKKRKEKIKKINILLLLNWPDIRPAPNGAQKLQKIENIILRCNM